jgi:hypothetical protein
VWASADVRSAVGKVDGSELEKTNVSERRDSDESETGEIENDLRVSGCPLTWPDFEKSHSLC